MMQLIVLGVVPGTEIQLGFDFIANVSYAILLALLLWTLLRHRTFSAIPLKVAAFRLNLQLTRLV